MKILRPMQETDLSLVYSTWLKGQRHGNSWFKSIDQDVYFQGYKRLIDARLGSSVSVVVCATEDPDVVLGYAVYSPDNTVLHWVYVKKAWRGMGLAKMLVPPSIQKVSSLTRLGKLIIKGKGIAFDPFQ